MPKLIDVVPQVFDFKHSVCCDELEYLHTISSDFHDTGIDGISIRADGYLYLYLSYLDWYDDGKLVQDHITRIFFRLNKAIFTESWGTDTEMCSSSVYHISIANGTFDIMTGDGQRIGTFDCHGSTVRIVTTPEIAKALHLV